MTFSTFPPRTFAVALAAASWLTAPAAAEIRWAADLATAHAEAQTTGKPLLLHFYGDNCVWCDRLEKGAFSTPQVAEAIDQGFVAVKIHAGEQPAVASMFRVRQWPTDVVVTPAGKVLSHGGSPQQPAAYIAMLADSSSKLPANAAAGAMELAATRPPGAEAVLAAGRTHSAGIDATLAGARTDAMSLGSPDRPASDKRDRGASELTHSKKTAATQTPDLIMNGYCAVSIIEENQWVEGNPQFGVIHLGQLYLFASEAKLQKFLANPTPYTPMLGGIDVIRFFEEKRIVQGDREFGMVDPVHQRIFLFADEDAMLHFQEHFQRYTDSAIDVMKRAVKDANPGA